MILVIDFLAVIIIITSVSVIITFAIVRRAAPTSRPAVATGPLTAVCIIARLIWRDGRDFAHRGDR